MDDAIGELTADALIAAGGWNPRYARVLLIADDGHHAVILVDGNGDGAELEFEHWQREPDGRWYGTSSSGHGPLDGLPAAQSWHGGLFVGAIGRAEPATEVSIAYGGWVYRRRANEYGIWGFVHAPDSADSREVPAVTAVGPSPR
jgi:hypothetical protein